MLFSWQTYCIIFVIVIVHELLICALMHIMVISNWKTHSTLFHYQDDKMYLYLEFTLKIQHHCGELIVKIYYIVQENIANLKQNILCN